MMASFPFGRLALLLGSGGCGCGDDDDDEGGGGDDEGLCLTRQLHTRCLRLPVVSSSSFRLRSLPLRHHSFLCTLPCLPA